MTLGKSLPLQFLPRVVETRHQAPLPAYTYKAQMDEMGVQLWPWFWGLEWTVFPPSVASLGSECHLNSKIKKPSAQSRPVFAANGHLTQLNGSIVGSVTRSVQELGSGLGVQRSKGNEPAGQGCGATNALSGGRACRLPPARCFLSQASPNAGVSVLALSTFSVGNSVLWGCAVPSP